MDGLSWRKSSRCESNACVEVAEAAESVHVRDAAGSVVTFDLEAWRGFVAGVRVGEFDRA